MATTILFLIGTFAFIIWPTKMVAGWFGAEKTGYGSVIFALFLEILFMLPALFLFIPLAFLGPGGVVVIVVIYLYAIGKACSIALSTPFWNGLWIAIAAWIFGIVLQLMFELIFDFSLFPEGTEI